jgi:hypothetical protein
MDKDKGGNIVVGLEDNKIVGVTILNNTNMKDFIPENILYISRSTINAAKVWKTINAKSHLNLRGKYCASCGTR